MRKRLISAAVSTALLLPMMSAVPMHAGAAARAYTRQVEYLTRGLVAVKADNGVFLSWRLLGTEPMTQTFDIYRDGVKIESGLDATNYVDNGGFSYNKYQVVPAGTADVDESCDKTEVWVNNYIDIPLDKPAGGTTRSGESYTYSVNDTSVADVDGDGEYEYIIKWDPSNSKDNSQHGYTGNVLLDCYELDGTKLWRIDLGVNIRAGAHYTQFIAYDFDGDGKAEVAMRTAPGSRDSQNKLVSSVGKNIIAGDDSRDYRVTKGKIGHNISSPDWLTMFNGQTGEAMQTVDYPVQRGSVKDWGDSYGGRSERYVAGVAYLDGMHPSLIMCRGYYTRATMGAYNWDGTNFIKLWVRDDKQNSSGNANKTTLYSNGNHQLSVADMDNDGKDEVTIGSAAADDNGGILHTTGHGHGDALHVSDFNNDGAQEVFTVHEEKTYYKTWGTEFRRGSNTDGTAYLADTVGSNMLAYTPANGDNGRGVMANIDDDYASAHGFHSYFWSAADGNLYADNSSSPLTYTETVVTSNSTGATATNTANFAQPSSCNSLIYWDGDLSRELLDRNRIDKYWIKETTGKIGNVENAAITTYGQTRLATFDGVHSNNSTKANAALSGDLFGDWREEVAYGTADDTALRIFTTTIPTDYKLTTLMHDTQYRCAIAWQNVGYNQPPHPSYYIGKDALKSGANYLEPAAGFDKVQMTAAPQKTVAVPDEETELLASSNSFDDGNWGIGTQSVTAAPYNHIVTTGTTTKNLDLNYEDDNQKYNITLKSMSVSGSSASAQIKNDSPNTFRAKLYTAAYTSGNVLSDVKITDAVIPAEQTLTVNSDAVTVPEGGYVRAFLWNNRQEPYTEAVTASTPISTDKVIDTVSGSAETVEFSFDWKPLAASNMIAIQNESGANIVSLSKTTSNAVKYAAGTSAAKNVNSTLTSNASWYHVDVTMDTTSKTADISVLDYTTKGSTEKMVYAASFAGVDGMPAKLAVTGQTSLDNINISKVTYNIERSLLNFNVTDAASSAVSDAKISIGGTTLTTDNEGKAAIKVKNGEYEYTISKTANKTVKDSVNADGEKNINKTLRAGEPKDVYIKYLFDNAMDITEALKGDGVTSEKVGTAIENTSYTVADSAKSDITGYTFSSDAEDLPPGYEDYAGQTVNLEFDPDTSNVVDVNVAEGSDTVIPLSYKIKRVPADTDTELLRIQYGEGGIGSDGASWSVTNNAYEQMSDSGKYIRVSGIDASKKLTVNIPNASSRMVMEFDMRIEELPWGGQYFGVIPYNGNTAGQGFGMRTSNEANGQWQLAYRKEQYLNRTSAASDKAYSYATNWRNQWMHMILVSDGTGKLYVTQANKDTGMVYVKDFPVTMLNSVATESKPINKLEFGYVASDSSNTLKDTATIGFKNFKAYTVGVSSDMKVTEKQIDVPSKTVFTATADHPSDMAGVTYDASAFLGDVTYELRTAGGKVVSEMPAGMTLTDDGVLTTTAGFDTSVPYRLVVNIGGQAAYAYDLTYRTKTLTTGTFKGFGSAGDLGNFSLTSASGYSLTNEGDGVLKYTRGANSTLNKNVYLTFPITKQAVEDEFYFFMDFKVVTASCKGYMFLKNSASGGTELTRAETHMYQPRIKFFTDSSYSPEKSFNSGSGFEKGTWFTYVYHGTDMSSASRNMHLDIYKTSELEAKGYSSTRDYTNVTDVKPVFSVDIAPAAADLSSGMYLVWQVSQNSVSSGADATDEWYFDNVGYQYYAFN